MADIWMDVDTAISEAPVNLMPLIDDTDFKSREVSIAYNESGMDLVWNFVTPGGAFTQTAVTPTTSGLHDWTHQGDGMYTIEIPTASGDINNTVEGFGWFTGLCDGVLPWRGPVIGFRSATINDALIDSDTFITSSDLGVWAEDNIQTVNSQTNFDLTSTISLDDTWIGHQVTIQDVSTGDFHETWITDCAALNNNIVINEAAGFTVVAADIVRIYKDKHPKYELTSYDPPTRTELTSDKDTIIDKVLGYFQLALRSDAGIATDRATELGEINTDEGSGVGDYSSQTDSQEKQADGVNVTEMNGTTVQGTGTTGDLWRG